MPPAPLNVPSPEDAERPAPHSARTRVEDWRTVLNSWMEVLGPEKDLGGWVVVVILRMGVGVLIGLVRGWRFLGNLCKMRGITTWFCLCWWLLPYFTGLRVIPGRLQMSESHDFTEESHECYIQEERA